MIRFKLTSILIAFLACCLMPPSVNSEQRDQSFTIYMAVWRGCEDACRGFQDYFREEGIDVNFIVRDANRDKTRLPEFVREARELKVDLVLTWGTSVTLGLIGKLADSDPVKHITDIPVVFMIVADPLGAGIIESYASSGRINVTGTRNRVPEEVQMKAIRAYRYFKHLGIIYNTNELNSVLNVNKIRELAKNILIKKLAPIDLPILSLSRYSYVINMQTAR